MFEHGEGRGPASTGQVLARLLAGVTVKAGDELDALAPSVGVVAALARRAERALTQPADPEPADAVVDPAADPTSLDAIVARDELLTLIGASERCLSWLHAVQLALVGALDRLPTPGVMGIDDLAREEVACQLRLTPGAAARRLELARDLRDRLPGTAALLAHGAISEWHARVLAEETKDLDPAGCAAVEDRVLPRAPDRTPPKLRAAAHTAAMAVDPASAEERRQRAAKDRRVTRQPAEDGMGTLWALLPAEDLAVCGAAVDAYAQPAGPDDERTLDQRRADALTAICRQALATRLGGTLTSTPPASPATGPTAGAPGASSPAVGTATPVPGAPSPAPAMPVPVTINVTVTADTLTGATDLPAQLAGHGPITAPAARAMTSWPGARFHRILLHPDTGALLATDPHPYGSLPELLAHAHDPPPTPPQHSPGCRDPNSRPRGPGRHPDPYHPSVSLAAYVRARDPVCTFAHCARRAAACDLDHGIDYAHGGPTCRCNMSPLCKRHHNLKTRHAWHLTIEPGGARAWTGPTGRMYTGPPHDHRPWH